MVIVSKTRFSISSVFFSSKACFFRNASLMVMPRPGPSTGGIEPRFPRSPPGMISLKTASSGSKNSRIRKFGIETQA